MKGLKVDAVTHKQEIIEDDHPFPKFPSYSPETEKTIDIEKLANEIEKLKKILLQKGVKDIWKNI